MLQKYHSDCLRNFCAVYLHRMQITQERSEYDLIKTPWSLCSKWL